MAPSRWPRPAAVGLAVVLPWSWFVLRDALGVVGDVIAILVPPVVLGVVLVEAVAARHRRWWLGAAASTLVFGLVAVVGPFLPAPTGPVAPRHAIRVVSANIEGNDRPVGALLAAAPDVLVIAEMAPEAEPALTAAYPYHAIALEGPAVAVFSRFPLRVLDRPAPLLPGLRVAVAAPDAFVLYALHVPRAWLTGEGGFQATVAEHHSIMDAIAARVAAEPGPVVLAGDLNSTDRGRDYRTFANHMVDVMRESTTSWTSTTKWLILLLRIDHIFVTRGWCGDDSHQLALPGSDHRGIAATVGPCAH